MRGQLRGYSRTVVGHHELHAVRIAAAAHRHPLRGVADGVVQQRAEQPDEHRRIDAGGDAGDDVDDELDPGARPGELLDGPGHHDRGGAAAGRHRHSGPGRRHQRLEDLAHRAGGVADSRVRPGRGVGVPWPVGEPVELGLEAGQRCAQLVRELRGELLLVPHHGGEPIQDAVQRAGELRQLGRAPRGPEPAVDVVGAPPGRLGAHLLHRPQRPRHVDPQHQVDDDEEQHRGDDGAETVSRSTCR